MPELEWGEHLISELMEVGPAMPGMAGPIPVTWQEIDAWATRTRTMLPSYEALLLRQLSQEYCGTLHKAQDRHYPRPEDSEDEEQTKRAVSEGFRNLIKAHS